MLSSTFVKYGQWVRRRDRFAATGSGTHSQEDSLKIIPDGQVGRWQRDEIFLDDCSKSCAMK